MIISLHVGIISLYCTTINLYDAIISLYHTTIYLYDAIISLYYVTISLYGSTISLYDATISLYHVIITLYDAMISSKMQLLKHQGFHFFTCRDISSPHRGNSAKISVTTVSCSLSFKSLYCLFEMLYTLIRRYKVFSDTPRQ